MDAPYYNGDDRREECPPRRGRPDPPQRELTAGVLSAIAAVTTRQRAVLEAVCDCGEIARWQDEVYTSPWTTRMADHCDDCHDRYVNYEPPEADGECFRGGEAAAFAAERDRRR